MSVALAWSLVVWSVISAVFVYGVVMFSRYYIEYRKKLQHIYKMPGKVPHWLWGNLHEFPGPNEEGLQWMKDRAATEPAGIGVMWFGPFFSTVNVFRAKTIKVLLKTSEPKPRDIGGYFNVEPWLGDGLLLSKGKKWERNRRLLTPAFHFDILRPYAKINNQCTDVFLRKIEEYIDKDEYFEVFANISQLTLDIILRCAFSYDNDCQLKGKDHPYVQAVYSLSETAVYRLLSPWLYPNFSFYLSSVGKQFKKDCDFVHSVTKDIIKQRKDILTNQSVESQEKSRYLDFLDVLLTAKDEDGKGLSEQEIRDEADTFMFEGHDTTASGISWTLFSLASHPEHQKKCQEEIDEILKDRNNKDIEWDDLPKLTYLTQCIKESLRLHTPVPMIERETTKGLDVEGYHIPAGTVVNINLYVLHHMPEMWPDPEEFKPERFDPENRMARKDQFAFLPFSAGPRNCIGQHFAMHEMKTVVAKILSRFTLSLHPEKKVEHRIVVVMKTENGMFMKATRR